MGILDVFKKKGEEDFTQRPPPLDMGPPGMPGPMPGPPAGIPGLPAPTMGLPPPPAPPAGIKREAPGVTLLTEDLEEISEAIIQEKWTTFTKDWGAMMDWKERIDDTVVELRTTLDNIEKKMDSIERAVLGKVEEYSKGIGDVRTELKAMQKVFGDVMPAFTENVKKLSDLAVKKKK
jgi:hypothetical protein